MTTPPIPERRRHPRVSAAAEAHISLPDGQVEGLTVDLSSHGLRCIVPKEFKPFEKVKVHLALAHFGHNTRWVRAEGVVVRVMPLGGAQGSLPKYEVAVFFPEMSTASRKALDRFLQAQAGR